MDTISENLLIVKEAISLSDYFESRTVFYLTTESTNLNLLPLRLDSMLFLYNRSTCSLSEVYKVKNGPMRQNELGKWYYHNGEWFLTSKVNLWERRSNLTGITIVNSLLPYNPLICDTNQDGIADAGMLVEAFKTIIDLTGMSVIWKRPADDQWGIELDNK